MQQAEKCPVCKAPWPGNKFVGEKALTTTDQNLQSRRRSTNNQQSGVGSSTQMSAATDMDEDSDEEVG